MSLASVNGYNISKLDYLLELAIITNDARIMCTEESIKKDVLVRIIDDTLLIQHAALHNINVSNNEVEESYIQTLFDLNNRYNFSEFMCENKLSENNLLNYVKNQLIIKKFICETIKKNIDITEEHLQEFFNENNESFISEDTVRLSHILIEKYDEEALLKAIEVRKQINSPDDFFKFVQSCSECPTCCQSGDLGYFVKGELIPELDQIVFKMELNEISQPIQTKFGYHILIITDKKKHKKTCFNDVKEALREHLVEIQTEVILIKLLKDLKEKAAIELFVSY